MGEPIFRPDGRLSLNRWSFEELPWMDAAGLTGIMLRGLAWWVLVHRGKVLVRQIFKLAKKKGPPRPELAKAMRNCVWCSTPPLREGPLPTLGPIFRAEVPPFG
jgi:hypothetical protein